jgi:subtilisin family serine protease
MRRVALLLLAAALAAGALVVPASAATPGAPYAPEYYFDQWHVPSLWAAGARGQGITIAEIDTGVDASVGVFRGRIVPGTDFGRLGGNGEVDRDQADYGHGTSMASIMVGRPGQFGIRGLAPDAKLMPVAIPLNGTSDAQADDRLPQAIRWAADHGAKIISMSLGGVRLAAQNSTACPDDEQQAIFYALRKGAVLFAASGNRGATDNAVEEPGVCLGVVSVGAVDKRGVVAPFSSRHRYLTMSAPGVNIASIGPQGAPFSGDGTSQATALASAAAALVWSKYPQLSGTQVVARMLATLDGRTAVRDPSYGYGRLDTYRAVTATVAVTAPDPVAALARPFLRAQVAAAQPARAPAPMPHAAEPPGSFRVGSAPRLFAPRVLWGAGVAGAGLLALLVLVIVGLAARRRRRIAAAHQPRHAAPDTVTEWSAVTHHWRPPDPSG